MFDRQGDRSLAIAISQTIEIGGQQGLRRDRARAEAAAGGAELRREQIEIFAEVTAAFYSAEGISRQLELEREVAALYARLAQTSQALLQRGSITRPESMAVDLERVRRPVDRGHVEREVGDLVRDRDPREVGPLASVREVRRDHREGGVHRAG